VQCLQYRCHGITPRHSQETRCEPGQLGKRVELDRDLGDGSGDDELVWSMSAGTATGKARR
jgi:hypothetical protein